jgi:hypothetical protein
MKKKVIGISCQTKPTHRVIAAYSDGYINVLYGKEALKFARDSFKENNKSKDMPQPLEKIYPI